MTPPRDTANTLELLKSLPPEAYAIHGRCARKVLGQYGRETLDTYVLSFRRSKWWQGEEIPISGDVISTSSFLRYCEVVQELLASRAAYREEMVA